VAAETGIVLRVLAGRDEARLTFLAARRWFGWSAGRLLVLDIGGGSLEIAGGIDEEPDVATSLPLGAGRLTRDWLPGDPPRASDVKVLRKHVRAEIAKHVRAVCVVGQPDRAVGSSKTFRTLARITGAAPSGEGLYVRRTLSHAALQPWLPKLAGMSVDAREQLPAVSPGRARQLLAGAVVADAVMDLLGLSELDISPWALREGVLLRHMDGLRGS
jgi:exopolyphosphatase/guanosine-5'-triphosphate,3'-diphosphate pyrophosphatase